MSARTRRLAAVLTLVAGASALSGCSGPVLAPGMEAPACHAPLACGPMYPVIVYPWAVHPYLGYLHDSAHTVIVTTGGRPAVTYRPYSPPLRPAFQTATTRNVPAPKPAAPAPKPAGARPAAPARPAPAVRTARK